MHTESSTKIGKYGVFHFLDLFSAAQTADFARQVEELGYSALWYPEAAGRNSLVQASWLLSHTKKLVVASGIANIYARDAQATVSGRNSLNELSGGRFLLGLGVSHAPLVEAMRGHSYDKPLSYMSNYLDKMATAAYQAPLPQTQGPTVLAALGPKMLELAGKKADGAHPYNVTPEHTQRARQILGPTKKLYVEHKVALTNDADQARAWAKQSLAFYLGLPNYRNNWLSLGFSEEEISGTSDRFLDALVAWGDPNTIHQKLDGHFKAGADHVCLQVVGASDPQTIIAVLKELAH